jgi:hypothetical protein
VEILLIRSKFHWSKAYKRYSTLLFLEKNAYDIWTLGIVKARCVLDVFDVIEMVSWCIDKYEKNQRIIQL